MFLGLTEIAGYYRNLQRGLAHHGVSADVVTLFPHALGYELDRDQGPEVARMVARLRRAFPERPPRRTPRTILTELYLRVRLLVWAVPRYDTFVFGFRNTFLNGWDLPLLRLLGKRVVCVFHGSDSRPPYIDRHNGEDLDGPGMATWIRRRRRVVRRIERWSDAVIVGALTTQLHEGPVVSFQVVGVAVPPVPERVREPAHDRPLRVVHAPSHPTAKGTAEIRAAVEALAARGVHIDYRELAGVRNEVVLRELEEADLLIDQVFSDTFLGGLGAEAAAAGCPTVVGGYELDVLADLVPESARPPGYYCHPDQLEDTIAGALRDHAGRVATGEAARRFVAAEWTEPGFGARFLRVLTGDVPPEWMLDPRTLTAVHGCGVDASTARAWIGSVVDAAGPTGLGVDAKPRLRHALLDFLAAGVKVGPLRPMERADDPTPPTDR